jgi:MFS superfamily sulfate permease-like transporter
VSPLSGIAKFTLKLLLAAFMASYLEHVPMACIGGILLYVAHGMVKKIELRDIMSRNKFHRFLMFFTAVMVPIFGFLVGVLAAIILYIALFRFFDKPVPVSAEPVISNKRSMSNEQ